ncbi:MAG TPA: site-specific integrase [Ktedonobacteraceae bacterium]|nr:site-specific integrase [Ktedonobacteraceae bacterium]
MENAILEWLHQKRVAGSDSEKTNTAYRDTMQSFRDALAKVGTDLLGNQIDIIRVATIWAAGRVEHSTRKGKVSDSTYNQRLACISSFYTFLQEMYKLSIDNPIKEVKRRKVQAYAYAMPMSSDEVEERLECIDQSTLQGKRDYAIICIGLMTGRRASELVGLRWKDVKKSGTKIILEFNCKGGKVRRNALDDDIAGILMDYLEEAYTDLDQLEPDAPVWISLSRQNSGQAISTNTLYDICDRYLGTTKIHTMRHTFAKEMEKSGATLTDIQHSLGHENITVTARYLKKLGSEDNPHAQKLAKRFGIRKRNHPPVSP